MVGGTQTTIKEAFVHLEEAVKKMQLKINESIKLETDCHTRGPGFDFRQGQEF